MAIKELKSIKFPGLEDIYVVAGKVDVDAELSATSENPVQNKVIKGVVDDLTAQIADAGSIDIDLTGANEGEVTPVNADTLGGFSAEEYIKKTVSSEDEGKFLRIVNGVATWTSIPNVREGSF